MQLQTCGAWSLIQMTRMTGRSLHTQVVVLHGEGKTQFKIAFHTFFAKIVLTQVSHITVSRFKAWKNNKLHFLIRGDAK